MQRAEAIGVGVAVVGHAVLFGSLSLGLMVAQKPVPSLTKPIDIQIVETVGLTDTVPDPSSVEPATSVAPEIGLPVKPSRPEPLITPVPKLAPAPMPPKPASKIAVATPKPAIKPAPVTLPRPKLALDLSRPTTDTPHGSRLGADFRKGLSDNPNASTAQTPRAAAGPAVAASLAREVLRQLKPFWRAPTGADAEQLRTLLSITLSRDGTVSAVRVLDTTGVTDSNRGQVRLHQEAAMKAVRLAAPFVLPAELYDAWKVLEPVGFDKGLG